MAAIEVGRVCVKTTGRDSGSKVVITKVLDKNFVQIKGLGYKKHAKCAIRHLEPTAKVVSAKTDAEVDAELAAN